MNDINDWKRFYGEERVKRAELVMKGRMMEHNEIDCTKSGDECKSYGEIDCSKTCEWYAAQADRIGDGHDSDCSTHNAPAYQSGECDCSARKE